MCEKLAIKFGADPEFFLVDSHDRPVSAHDRVPGTKDEPHKIKGGAVQADGTAVEFNIDPASSGEEFAANVETVLKEVRKLVDKNLTFKFKSYQEYPGNIWERIPNTAKTIGCDPDFLGDLHGIRWEPVSRSPLQRFGSQCYAGGHLHVGWTKDQNPEGKGHLFDCCAVVFAMDHSVNELLKVLPSPRIKDTYNAMDHMRRNYGYGVPGCMRPKSYGVEYRTPSNTWLRYPDLWPWLFDCTTMAVNRLQDGDITPNTKVKLPKNYYYGDDGSTQPWTAHTNHSYTPEHFNEFGKRKWGDAWVPIDQKMVTERIIVE